MRALVDDGTLEPAKVTRDYLLHVAGGDDGAPLLSVFGGKITTYRRLAERAMEKLAPLFPKAGGAWTASARLPGGDVPGGDCDSYARTLCAQHGSLPESFVRAVVRRHGARAPEVIGSARATVDLGEHFGADLYAAEVDYFLTCEWACDVEDILWRRTKAGLHLSADAHARLTDFVHGRIRDAAMP